MTTSNAKMTILEAENLVDQAQQEIERILTDLANSTGLWIDPVEIRPWRDEGKAKFTVLIHACLPIGKG